MVERIQGQSIGVNMRYLFILFLFPLMLFAQDKGWNVAIDKTTGKIVEKSYGDSGYQHLVDEGYAVIRGVPSSEVEKIENEDLKWNDKNKDGEVQKEEIIKLSKQEITNREEAKRTKEIKQSIIDLSQKKDKADTLGFTDLSVEYQQEIDKLQIELQAIK